MPCSSTESSRTLLGRIRNRLPREMWMQGFPCFLAKPMVLGTRPLTSPAIVNTTVPSLPLPFGSL